MKCRAIKCRAFIVAAIDCRAMKCHGTNLLTPEAEFTYATRQCTGRESNSRSVDHKSDALTTTPLSGKCLTIGL